MYAFINTYTYRYTYMYIYMYYQIIVTRIAECSGCGTWYRNAECHFPENGTEGNRPLGTVLGNKICTFGLLMEN